MSAAEPWAARYTAQMSARGWNPDAARECAHPDCRGFFDADHEWWAEQLAEILRGFGWPEDSVRGAIVSRLVGNLYRVHRMSPMQVAETLDAEGAACRLYACDTCQDFGVLPHLSRDPQREQRCPDCGGAA